MKSPMKCFDTLFFINSEINKLNTKVYFQAIFFTMTSTITDYFPDSKVHGANMGPTLVLSAPDGPHVGPMNLAIRVGLVIITPTTYLQVSQTRCECHYTSSSLDVQLSLPWFNMYTVMHFHLQIVTNLTAWMMAAYWTFNDMFID